MLCQLILGILLVQLQHIAVTADFGQNGRCADAGAGGVALHHRLRGHGQPGRDAVAVHKDEVRHDVQPLHGLTHPAHGGIQDIVAVDDVGADEDDLVSQCLFNDLVEKSFPLFLAQLLGVVDAVDRSLGVKDAGGHADRAAQRAASCLVYARKTAVLCRMSAS